MLIPVSHVKVGDLLMLPRGSLIRVEGVDVYDEPMPVTDDPEPRYIVRWKAAERSGSLAPRTADETVVLHSRSGTPVLRW